MLETVEARIPTQDRKSIETAVLNARERSVGTSNRIAGKWDEFNAGQKFPEDRVLFSSESDFNIFQEIPSLASNRYYQSSVELTRAVSEMDYDWVNAIRRGDFSLIDMICEYSFIMDYEQISYNFIQWLIINHSTISANSLDNNSLLNNEFKQEVIKTFGELPYESVSIIYRNTLDLYVTLMHSRRLTLFWTLEQDFVSYFIDVFKTIRGEQDLFNWAPWEFLRLLITSKEWCHTYYTEEKERWMEESKKEADGYKRKLCFVDWYLLRFSPDHSLFTDPYTREEITPKKLEEWYKESISFQKGMEEYCRNTSIRYTTAIEAYKSMVTDECLYSFKAYMCAQSKDADRLMTYWEKTASNFSFKNIAQYFNTHIEPVTYKELFDYFTSSPTILNDESTNSNPAEQPTSYRN